jgi:preprotein translocase SecE subunit
MAYVTKSTQQENKELDLPEKPEPKPDAQGDSTPPRRPTARSAASSGGDGFFTIYKKGQGYWTRIGTVIGIAVVAVFTAFNLYVYIPTFLPSPTPPPSMSPEQQAVIFQHAETLHTRIGVGVAGAFLLGALLLGFWITNKPSSVDFLISTDSEMKKVNWTSRKDLIASTKIVIIFMFSVAIFLFVVDILFHYLFHFIGVLKTGPFGA